MTKLRRNISRYPELWRVKYYGGNGDQEGWHTVLVMAPKLEMAFDVVRKECDELAAFESVTHAVVHFSEECFLDEPLLATATEALP